MGKRIMIALPLVFCLIARQAPACTVCHSKNPKMVRMHAALNYKDCFICHGPNAKKSNDPPEKQRLADDRCIRCHVR